MASLPPSVYAVDIRDWTGLSPVELLSNPVRTAPDPGRPLAARVLKYARSGSSTGYDEIGYRTVSAIPSWVKGPVAPVTLQTIAGMRADREREGRRWLRPELQELLDQQLKLKHRPLDIPEGDRYRYRYHGDYIDLVRMREGPDGSAEEADVWTFPISLPPRTLLENAVERDVGPLFSQVYRVGLPGVLWLTLSALIERGEFLPMQAWGPALVEETRLGCFYGFVSHRWLSREHPDPLGTQARFCAWQLVSHLCKAIRVAQARGLHRPRRFNGLLGFPVGVFGNELAESLLVNVLRHALDEESIGTAAGEVASIEPMTRDYGVVAAADEEGLPRLAGILEERPVLRGLVGRIHLWYDYSCLPQDPRTEEEEALFRSGLKNLNAIQIMGRTLVLLDEVEDYMSRAWCTLEALLADSVNATIDLLVGSERARGHRGEAEIYFQNLHADRPHVVWRALLDTELFRVQGSEVCMERLGVRVTDPLDLPFIYERLRTLGTPTKIHADGSELLTGVVPIPMTEGGRSARWITNTNRQVDPREAPGPTASLDWTDARRLPTGWDSDSGDDAALVPPHLALEADAPPSAPTCHVAVVASCEGEAILLANWARKRRAELEALLGVGVASISWLAIDIAPVGHFVQGDLRAVPVAAEVFVILTMGARLDHCTTTGALAGLLRRAGCRTALVSVDESENNVRIVEPKATDAGDPDQGDADRIVPLDGAEFPSHPGGLFRTELLHRLIN